MDDELETFQNSIDIHFKNRELLRQALVHSSYLNENPDYVPASYERMEFLGDAVLGMVVGEALYRQCPDCPEGELTQRRSVLVRRETLARRALAINLDRFLYFGRGEEASGGRSKPVNLASGLEAIIGAIYLDRGLLPVRKFILKLFEKELRNTVAHGEEIDYKSRLQAYLQSTSQLKPDYAVVEVTGPDHAPVFTVEVRAGSRVLGRGTGKSKKAAETAAAHQAMELLG